MKASDDRFNWEDFTFSSDAQREQFFEAVERGDHERAEAICNKADADRFRTVN